MQTSDRKSDKCKIRSFQVDVNVFRWATKISFMDKKNIGTVDGTVCLFVCYLFTVSLDLYDTKKYSCSHEHNILHYIANKELCLLSHVLQIKFPS